MPVGLSLKNRRAGRTQTHVVIPSGDTADRPSQPVFGSIRFNIDTGHVEFWDGVKWVNMALEGKVDVIVEKFTGDNSTQIFPLSETVTSSDEILVFVGNVWQAPEDNYTISGANELQLPFAPVSEIDIHVIYNFNSNSITV